VDAKLSGAQPYARGLRCEDVGTFKMGCKNEILWWRKWTFEF